MKSINIFDKLFFLLWGIVILVAWGWSGSFLIDELNTFGAMQAHGVSPSMEDIWPHVLMIIVTGSAVLAPFFMIVSLLWDLIIIPTIKKHEEIKGNHDRL